MKTYKQFKEEVEKINEASLPWQGSDIVGAAMEVGKALLPRSVKKKIDRGARYADAKSKRADRLRQAARDAQKAKESSQRSEDEKKRRPGEIWKTPTGFGAAWPSRLGYSKTGKLQVGYFKTRQDAQDWIRKGHKQKVDRSRQTRSKGKSIKSGQTSR